MQDNSLIHSDVRRGSRSSRREEAEEYIYSNRDIRPILLPFIASLPWTAYAHHDLRGRWKMKNKNDNYHSTSHKIPIASPAEMQSTQLAIIDAQGFTFIVSITCLER